MPNGKHFINFRFLSIKPNISCSARFILNELQINISWLVSSLFALHCSNHLIIQWVWELHETRTQHFEPYTVCYEYTHCVHSSLYHLHPPISQSPEPQLSFPFQNVQSLCGVLSLLICMSLAEFELFVHHLTPKKHMSHLYLLKAACEGQPATGQTRLDNDATFPQSK